MKKLLLSSVLSVCMSVLMAQNTATSYTCDFEDATEVSQWVLNAGNRGATSKNKWHVGAAGSFGLTRNAAGALVLGTQGLYLADEAADPNECGYYATNYACFQIAYRDMNLAPGNYSIQFDYKGMGNTNDKMIVCWVPSTTNPSSNNSTTTVSLPSWVSAGAIECRGKDAWTSKSGSIQVTGTGGGKLVVIWINQKGMPKFPGAAIDNIRIFQGQPCNSPSSVAYDKQQKRLTWANAGSQTYDVLVFNLLTGTCTPYVGQSGQSMVVPSIVEEGMYYFYVRSRCSDDLHAGEWASCMEFVWILGARCLDYMDLDNARCYRGPFDHVTGTGHILGKVDQGYASINSFHTIHYMPSERDPRTSNRLKTIPDGEIASVRLGNWRADASIQSQGAGEAIEYQYPVKAGESDVLVIQYAIVMEIPGHNDGTDPHFYLQILDQNGQQIGGQSQACFSADFAAATNNPSALAGWNLIPHAELDGVEGVGSSDIIWKPWSSVSVTLGQYVGQTLTIRLQTMDCRQSAHWAYAYFTVGCQSGSLQGISCGDTSTDRFEAPDGFNYRWYYVGDEPAVHRGDNSKVMSTDQIFHISQTSDSIYMVDLISKTAGACYYSLYANPNPRFATADVEYEYQPVDCKNRVVVHNRSKVYFINRRTGQAMTELDSEPVDSVTWDWGDGVQIRKDDSLFVHDFPAEGGTFRVHTKAYLNGEVCMKDTFVTLTLPAIKDSTYTLDTTICRGGFFIFEGQRYKEEGVYPVMHKSVAGCDSIHELHLSVVDRFKAAIDRQQSGWESVCGDDSLRIPIFVDAFSTEFDTVLVHLADSTYAFHLTETGENILSIPLFNKESGWYMRPNFYNAEVEYHSRFCSSDPETFDVTVHYASFILFQRRGFISVYDPEHNRYGDEFENTYHWYRDGELMPDSSSTILLLKSDIGHTFRVEVTRKSDGVTMSSCEMVYTNGRTAVDELYADDKVIAVYDMLGRRYSTIPSNFGVYVIVYGDHTEKLVLR